ncbi:MAG: phosphotransferase [Candidatus Brocadiia bacterium]
MPQTPTPVFGLTHRELGPVLEAAAGQPIARFDVAVEHEVSGYAGYQAQKCIPTFRYTTRSGRTGEAIVFGKYFHRSGPAEAHCYELLSGLGAPIPRLYHVLHDQDGREILFMEYLEALTMSHEDFAQDEAAFLDFLSAAARLNALRPSASDGISLPERDVAGMAAQGSRALAGLWQHARSGELGEEFRAFCTEREDGLPRLQSLAEATAREVPSAPTGLIHADLHPENTGRRPGTGELLIFDLESLSPGPAWYDAALWIGAPDDVQPRFAPRDQLARHYIRCYAEAGGEPPPLDEFLDATRVLWLAWKFGKLGWRLRRALDGHGDWTDDREAVRTWFRTGLLRDLKALLSRRWL